MLDSLEFLVCIRKARRGAAGGPSGMTSDHLFPVLESEGDSVSLARVVSMFAVGNVPVEIIEATAGRRLKTWRVCSRMPTRPLPEVVEQRRALPTEQT